MSLNYMVNGQMVEHVPKILYPGTGQLGDPAEIVVWDGAKYVRVWPEPPKGVAYTDALNSLAGFTQTKTADGVESNNGQAAWPGGSSGSSRVLYNQPAMTDNQYVAVDLATTTARTGTLICHCDDAATGWYGASWSSGSTIAFGRGSGMWNGSFDSTIASVNSGTPGGTGKVELWNVGDQFRVAVNGTVVINTTVANSIRGTGYRRQGLGMYRTAFLSTGRIETWYGGDAVAYGK
ncbi:minor tail protein [Gordonia phage Mollymur]|uniref:Minor tail protein n=1 Tax=Gordonia phage Mollymur TaxID=2590895 RepID=A0A4Y6E9R0_9CAUD|nr:virion structural protein [Gordonia phage Mollymur]QDF15403.1 minor tail protein [Gordonia phage Mollymur]